MTSEDKFRALLEAAPDAIVIVDERGRIDLVNAQAEAMFGYSRAELIGASIELLVPERARAAHVGHRRNYLRAARTRPMGAGLDLHARRKDGTEFPVEISLSPLTTDEGVLTISAIRDITDRKLAAEERARLLHERAAHAEADRVKDEFLATLSHELRTPLNAILGWTRLVRDGAITGAGVAKALAVIERNAQTQAHLIEDLLDVSRIVSGTMGLQPLPMDFCDVVDLAVEVVRPAAAEKNVRLHVVFRSRPLAMTGDPDRLQQAVWNLLSNAVKFSYPDGEVDIEAWAADGNVHCTVSDAGRGITPKFLSHVFDRFRQGDSSYTRAGGGLGLGLAIVRSVAELHGGRIEASSAGEGHGATFSMTLPAQALSTRVSHDEKGSAREPGRLEGVRVLVVDDRPDERDLFETILSAHGATVAVAESAHRALETIEHFKPTVLISDIAMPDADGFALLRQVRALPTAVSRVPAIAVTAHARGDDRTAALSAGFQEYIAKPVDRSRLVRAVHDLAGHSR